MIMNALSSKKIALGLMAALFAISTSSGAMAETKWERHHPRRDQVNDRLENQSRRIHQERKEGELTKAQAANLHRQDAQIRQEERDMASQNGGHITKSEQAVLNRQENRVSQESGTSRSLRGAREEEFL